MHGREELHQREVIPEAEYGDAVIEKK